MNKSCPAWLVASVMIALALAASACGQTATPPAAPLVADAAAFAEATRSAEPAPTARQSSQPTAQPVAATAEPIVETEAQPDGPMPFAMPTSGRIDGETPIVLGVGRPVGVTPDGSALITTGAHPGGHLSCEGSPAEAFWLVPLDGSPRSLLSEHEIHSGGVDSFSIHEGKAAWMQWCDGFPIGPYTASISDSGALNNIEFIDVVREPGAELGNPRWLNDGSLSIAHSGQGIATMLIVDSTTGATISTREVPIEEAFPRRTDWEWDQASGRWIVPLSTGAEVSVPGFGSDLNVNMYFDRPVEHPTLPVVFLTMLSETPAFYQVIAVPLATSPPTETLELTSGLPSTTPLVRTSSGSSQPLLPLRDGVRWLMQSVDPADPCSAEVFLRSLGGVDQPLTTDQVVRPLTGLLINGSDLMFTSGCQGGPQTLTWASLILDGPNEPELNINVIAKVPFASEQYFRSFEVVDDQLEAPYGDPALDTRVTLSRDGVVQVSSTEDAAVGPLVRDPLCEISTSLPPNWSVNVAGGGAGGIELRHSSGASVLAVCTSDDLLSRFEVDPRTNPPQRPVESVAVTAYDPDVRYSFAESFDGNRWTFNTTTDGQPGWSDILQAQVSDRWIHVIGNAPGAADLDPSVVGAMTLIIDQVRVGTTGG